MTTGGEDAFVPSASQLDQILGGSGMATGHPNSRRVEDADGVDAVLASYGIVDAAAAAADRAADEVVPGATQGIPSSGRPPAATGGTNGASPMLSWEETTILGSLIAAARNEAQAPEILPYPAIIDDTVASLHQQRKAIDALDAADREAATRLASADPAEALQIVSRVVRPQDLLAQELQRITFIIVELLRTRLRKIQQLLFYIEANEVIFRQLLSPNELATALRLARAKRRALIDGGMRAVPRWLLSGSPLGTTDVGSASMQPPLWTSGAAAEDGSSLPPSAGEDAATPLRPSAYRGGVGSADASPIGNLLQQRGAEGTSQQTAPRREPVGVLPPLANIVISQALLPSLELTLHHYNTRTDGALVSTMGVPGGRSVLVGSYASIKPFILQGTAQLL